MVTFQFVPFDSIAKLSSNKRVSKLLRIVKNDKIVILEGRLTPEEEAHLIERTMAEISHPKFSGIELGRIDYDQKRSGWDAMKHKLATMLVGERRGLTVIGPATIIEKIVNNPSQFQLFMK